jgi:hypothetical protein
MGWDTVTVVGLFLLAGELVSLAKWVLVGWFLRSVAPEIATALEEADVDE